MLAFLAKEEPDTAYRRYVSVVFQVPVKCVNMLWCLPPYFCASAGAKGVGVPLEVFGGLFRTFPYLTRGDWAIFSRRLFSLPRSC